MFEFSDAEIAALLKRKPSFAFNQIAMARELVVKLPNTLDAMEKGEIDLYKVRVLHDQTLPLTVEQAAEVEERVLVKARRIRLGRRWLSGLAGWSCGLILKGMRSVLLSGSRSVRPGST